jgi:hypothetical protein
VPVAEELATLPSVYSLISFNIFALMVDELNTLLSPSGPVIGILSAPYLLAPPVPGTGSSMIEQGALGLQNGL